MPRMVSIVIVGLMLLIATALEVSPLAQRPDCSTDQRLDSVTRRREAIVRARNVNTRQAQQRATTSRYATAEELGLADDNGSRSIFGVRQTATWCSFEMSPIRARRECLRINAASFMTRSRSGNSRRFELTA